MRYAALALTLALPVLAHPEAGDASRGKANASQFFDAGAFQLQGNYELGGTVVSLSSDATRITVQRSDEPPAVLTIAPDTRVRIDGVVAQARDIVPGAEVRATFNIARETPLALRLEVLSPDDAQRQGGTASGKGAGGFYDPYYTDRDTSGGDEEAQKTKTTER